MLDKIKESLGIGILALENAIKGFGLSQDRFYSKDEDNIDIDLEICPNAELTGLSDNTYACTSEKECAHGKKYSWELDGHILCQDVYEEFTPKSHNSTIGNYILKTLKDSSGKLVYSRNSRKKLNSPNSSKIKKIKRKFAKLEKKKEKSGNR